MPLLNPLPHRAGLRLGLLTFGIVGSILCGPQASEAAAPGPPADSTSPNLGQPFNPSTADQQALSTFLKQRGALFYGAWWCLASFKQKNLFGQEAGNQLPYVECEKHPGDRERCQTLGIKAYPTWVLGNQRLEGVQSLDTLKRWSGFDQPGQASPAPAPTQATPVPGGR